MNNLFQTITNKQHSNNDNCTQSLFTGSIANQYLLIEGLVIEASIGILPQEYEQKQPIIIDTQINVEQTIHVQKDDIRDVISYSDLIDDITNIVQAQHYGLVESLIKDILQKLSSYPEIKHINISVKKPDIIDNAQSVGISARWTR